MDKVLELNQILDTEIEFCEKYENLLTQKRDLLVHSKALELRACDEQIYAAQKELSQINTKRIDVSKEFGNGDLKLSDIIKNLEDKVQARELEIKRKKIEEFARKISTINDVVNSLLEHSMKLIDGTITSLASAIAATQTKGDYYNKDGTTEHQNLSTISAIIEEA